jgi:hypothetical protein
MYKLDPIPTMAIPNKQYAIPIGYEFCAGKIVTPTCIAIAINAMLDKVPKPGFSLSGIQRSSTRVLIPNVDQPIVMSKRFEIPCAKTDHGAFPISL